MPELAVDPAVLLDVAGPLGEAAERLAAVAAALPTPDAALGPHDVTHALENAAHVWQHALRGAAVALSATGGRLVSAAATYDAVEAVVSDWSAS